MILLNMIDIVPTVCVLFYIIKVVKQYSYKIFQGKMVRKSLHVKDANIDGIGS